MSIWTQLSAHKPLPIVGVIHAYAALLAQKAGFKALYVSGASIANAYYGLPDLGFLGVEEVAQCVRMIRSATDLPLLVDIDTGWGEAPHVVRNVHHLIQAGAAAIHIEDQHPLKRCGHREGKHLVTLQAMCDKLKAIRDSSLPKDFMLMARTDAYGVEPFESVLARVHAYVSSGAQAIFAEAVTSEDDLCQLIRVAGVPVLVNVTEFGKTPLWTHERLGEMGVAMALHPLTAFRAMNHAAAAAYQQLASTGTISDMVPQLETRETLYTHLDYAQYEAAFDQLLKEKK
ncbi:MAG: isocitrate lyase/phosphoenolpyruvate mutase family protein [Pseudomonadota bacterium]